MQKNSSFWRDLFHLMHLYTGIFIAPFIFVAAFTGLLYALTPQIEQSLYHQVLYTSQAHTQQQPLSLQVAAAQSIMPKSAHITEVRPAPAPDRTTRVIFSDQKNHLDNEAVFINPYTLKVQGQLPVYGTSGVLPFRTFLDQIHRNLLLGDFGRIYSELAASWLGILAITGLYQWYKRRQYLNKIKINTNPLIQRHSTIGLLLLPLLLFISITGLSWSQWAGENLRIARQWLAWQTPTLTTSVNLTTPPMPMMHHDHHVMSSEQHMPIFQATDFNDALAIARQHGIDATQIQIRPPQTANQAWTVTEIQQRWPTQVDSIAIDLQHHKVIDQLYFKDYPFVAKLTRWGIDAHIGLLFGWVNQLILVLYALGLCSIIIYAFRSWRKKSTFKQSARHLSKHSIALYHEASKMQKIMLIAFLTLLSICMPAFGISILCVCLYILLSHYFSSV